MIIQYDYYIVVLVVHTHTHMYILILSYFYSFKSSPLFKHVLMISLFTGILLCFSFFCFHSNIVSNLISSFSTAQINGFSFPENLEVHSISFLNETPSVAFVEHPKIWWLTFWDFLMLFSSSTFVWTFSFLSLYCFSPVESSFLTDYSQYGVSWFYKFIRARLLQPSVLPMGLSYSLCWSP